MSAQATLVFPLNYWQSAVLQAIPGHIKPRIDGDTASRNLTHPIRMARRLRGRRVRLEVVSYAHRFWRVNERMKRVIVQIFPAEGLPEDPSLEHSAELASGAGLIPATPAVRSQNGNGENLDPEVRVEAILSAERARTVVDTVLNVKGTEVVDTFDRLIDLLVQREMTSDNSGQLFNRVMSSVEKALVERAFVECDHVQTRTAERLGVNRNTVHKKLLKHELLGPDDEALSESDDELIKSHPDHELNDLPV